MKLIRFLSFGVCFILFIGSSLVWAQPQPLYIQSDSMEVEQNQKLITFKGHVKARQEDTHLEADLVRVFYVNGQTPDPRKEIKKNIERIEAEGHVIITQENRKAIGERAIFYKIPQERIVLTGNPQLQEGKNIIKGEKVIIYVKENRMVVQGGKQPVQATIYPEKLKVKP
ncbi:MAG: hypothetical protein LWW94_00225 [Candidatus Desulfofervidaceae bacterium]|nr:hypothetical protein [Candidatus Desulfofervidaceae bacterium]